MTHDELVAAHIRELSQRPEFATAQGLNSALRQLAIWRSRVIDREVIKRAGMIIQSGPFEGMRFDGEPTETNLSPKLLGVYETQLHDIVEGIIASDVDCIVDVGCADGYYAVGFATRMPSARIHAFDTNPQCQARTRRVAQINGVADRVTVGATFDGKDFAVFQGRTSLAFVDIEGDEDELLRPDRYPGLRSMSILVECHDVFKSGLSSTIAERFAETHEIEEIGSQLRAPVLPAWLKGISDMDQFIAAWEWRRGSTPWLYMRPKSSVPGD